MKRLAIAALLPLALALVCWGLQSPSFDAYLTRHAPQWALRAGFRVGIGGLDFDLRGPALRIRDLSVSPEKGEWTASARSLSVRFHPLRSLLGTAHLDLEAEEPKFEGEVPMDEKKEQPSLPKVVFDTLRVSRGSASVRVPALELGVFLPAVEVDWSRGKGKAQLQGGALTWRGAEESLLEITVAASRRWRLTVEEVAVRTRRLTLLAKGKMPLKGRIRAALEVRVDGANLPLEWLKGLRIARYAPVAGAVALGARVEGTLEDPRFRGNLEISPGRFGPASFEGAEGSVEADLTSVSFRDLRARTSFGAARELSGRLSWGKETRLEARGRAEGFDLRPFMALFSEGFFPVGLKASGAFEVRGPLRPALGLECKVEGEGRDLDVTTVDAAGPTTWFALPSGKVSSRCVVREHDLVLGATRIDADSVRVEVPRGRIEYETGLDFTTNLEIQNLALVRRYFPEVLARPGQLETRGWARGRLHGPYHALKFEYDLDLASVVLFGEDLGRLAARAQYDLQDLVVEDGTLSGPLGRIHAAGRATLQKGGPLDVAVEWPKGDLAQAAIVAHRISPEVPQDLQGRASVKGKVVGTLEDPVFEGVLTAADARAFGVAVDETQARVQASPSRWRVDRLTAEALGGHLEAEGSGDLEAFRAKGTVVGVSLERVGTALGKALPVGGTLGGSLVARGLYASPTAALTARVVEAKVEGRAVGDVALAGGLEGARLKARVSAFGDAAVAEGTLGLGGDKPYAVDVSLRRLPGSAVPADLLPGGLVIGSISGEGRAEGGLSAERPLKAARWDGSVGGLRIGSVDVGAVTVKGRVREGRAEISLGAWGGEAAAEVAAPLDPDPPVELRLALERLDLAHFASLGGVPQGRVWATGAVTVSTGKLKNLEGWGRLRALGDVELVGRTSPLAVSDAARAPALSFRASSPEGKLQAEVKSEAFRLRAAIADPEVGDWSGVAEFSGVAPAEFVPPGHALAELAGTLRGRVEAKGRAGSVRSASGSGVAQDVSWGPVAPSRWTWSLRYDGDAASFEADEPRGIETRGSWSRRQGLRVTAALNGIPVEGWTRPGVLPADLTGVARGEAKVDLPTGGSLRGSLRLKHFAVSLPPVQVETAGEVAIDYEGGAFRVEPIRLVGDGFDLTIAGRLAPGKSWDLTVDGKGDLAVLSRNVPKVKRASGKVRAQVAVTGPWKAPAVDGPVEIQSGAYLAIEGLDYPLEDLDARARFEADRGVGLEWLDAQFGEGRLHWEGFVGLEGLKPTTLRLLGELRNIAYELPKQVTYQCDGDFVVSGTVNRPEVRGEIRLTNFLYARRLALKTMILDILKRRPKGIAGGALERGGGDVLIDLSIQGSEDVRVQNNIADVELAVDLRARGLVPNPQRWGSGEAPLPPLWGRIEARSGTVRFRSVEYDVLPSTVEFLGEARPLPLLDVHARATVRNYGVSVDVSGPLDNYQVNLASAPPLAQNDLVALLTLGSTSDELTKGGGGVSVGEATSFVTGKVQDELESEVSDILGFDEFHIDPSYSSANQSSVPRITVGKTVTRALFARYSAAIGAETEQSAEVQYTLTPSVQLLGSWSEKGSETRGSFGGEIRFRFTFR